MSDSPTSTSGLRRDLGLPQATALAVTNMIGIGPFITISLMLGTMGGPQALLGPGGAAGLLRRAGLGGIGDRNAQGRRDL